MRMPDGTTIPLKVRSLVGLLPLCAATVFDADVLDAPPGADRARAGVRRALRRRRAGARPPARPEPRGPAPALARRRGPAAADPRGHARRGGVPRRRTGSARSRAATSTQPCVFDWGGQRYEVHYLPAESDTGHVRRQLQLARAGLVPDEPRDPARRCCSCTATTATASRSSARPAPGAQMNLLRGRDRDRPAPDHDVHRATRTAGGRCSAASRSSRATRTGTTCSCSTSTSTATTAPASAPATRPAGPGRSRCCSCWATRCARSPAPTAVVAE